MGRSLLVPAALCLLACVAACKEPPKAQPTPSEVPALSAPTVPSASPAAIDPPANRIVLIAGGDIDLSRRTGQRILRDSSLDPLASLRPLTSPADVRFANLESQLCDLGGSTGSPTNPLIFAGPPQGAEVLQRGLIDVVSTANNHSWDYGLRCLSETLTNLDRVGVQHAGTDPSGRDPHQSVIVRRNGRSLAIFASTLSFNDGPLPQHLASKYVAYGDIGAIGRRIAAVRSEVDWVMVSLHWGDEYTDVPTQAHRAGMRAAVDAGADVVVGHHPHTPQRVEWHRGRPIVFSPGNLVFHENSNHPWTGWGYLARITLDKEVSAGVELCPYHLVDASAQRLGDVEERAFFAHWDRISIGPGVARRGERTEDGCTRLLAP